MLVLDLQDRTSHTGIYNISTSTNAAIIYIRVSYCQENHQLFSFIKVLYEQEEKNALL
jgi:hypothetical protein